MKYVIINSEGRLRLVIRFQPKLTIHNFVNEIQQIQMHEYNCQNEFYIGIGYF